MSVYKGWDAAEGYRSWMMSEITSEKKALVIGEEEEEVGDFGDDDFVGLCELFDGDVSLLKHNLSRMLSVSRFLIERYFPAFHLSGLASRFVAALAWHEYDVRVYVLQIATNLSTNEEVPEYAEKLVENNLLKQLLSILKDGEESELVFWGLGLLANIASLSLSLRDQILEEISCDYLCALAQTRQLDPGCHNELLKLFKELSIDLNQEHVAPMFETVFTFLPDFLEVKSRLCLEILFILTNYPDFYTYFSQYNLMGRMRALFLKTTNSSCESLLLSIFIKTVREDHEGYCEILPKCRDLLASPNIPLFIGSAVFFVTFFELDHTRFFPEILGILYERQKSLPVRHKTEAMRLLLRILINLGPEHLLTYPVPDLIDAMLIDDIVIRTLCLQVLSKTLECAVANGSTDYTNSFVANDGLTQLDDLFDETQDDETRSLITSIRERYFPT